MICIRSPPSEPIMRNVTLQTNRKHCFSKNIQIALWINWSTYHSASLQFNHIVQVFISLGLYYRVRFIILNIIQHGLLFWGGKFSSENLWFWTQKTLIARFSNNFVRSRFNIDIGKHMSERVTNCGFNEPCGFYQFCIKMRRIDCKYLKPYAFL